MSGRRLLSRFSCWSNAKYISGSAPGDLCNRLNFYENPQASFKFPKKLTPVHPPRTQHSLLMNFVTKVPLSGRGTTFKTIVSLKNRSFDWHIELGGTERKHAHDVEFGIKDVDALHHPVQVWHRERCVAFILAHRSRIARNLLKRARDDEVRCLQHVGISLPQHSDKMM